MIAGALPNTWSANGTYNDSMMGVALVIDVPAGTVDGPGHDTISDITEFSTRWPGPVSFTGSTANETLSVGNATILTASGGAGDDYVYGGATQGGATIDGGTGNDHVYGTNAIDTLSGGADDDVLIGYRSADTLDGGPGIDLLGGGAGSTPA